jgi:predicted ATPase/DNA-binding SARP family transcriptional activator
MELRIAILGSVEPRLNGDLVGVPAGKQRALLTLLAVRAPQPVSAEFAAEALWPRVAPTDAMRSLQVTVSRLRRSLGTAGSALETVASGYRLAVDAGAIDTWCFEALVAEARAARVEGDAAGARRLLDAALGLWRGPALADVGFESFAQGEIARLEELRVAALEERIDARLVEGEHALVVAELEQLSAEHPSRERLVGLLMLALYRCGRQTDALEVYTRGRLRLEEDLGLEPSPELQRLQQAILRHEPSLDAPGRGDRDERQAPEGVVTMLFTDIEGSTRLMRAAGSLWPQLLAEHHALVLDAVERAGGHVDGCEGDALFAYFVDPSAAVEAAIAAQQGLHRHAWPEPVGELRVRMGIHAGLVSRAATGYSGLEVHLAARVMAAGHGGQVLVSAAARALLGSRFELVDLGEHRLRDFPAPERLWLLVHDDRGPGDFPPLRTEPVRPTNLPADPLRLVGREAELASLWDLLTGRERLVTILGLGGIGKTRLAVAAAEGLLSAFAGGVWLVSLAGVRDPVGLIPAIAAALGVADADSRSPEDAVAQRLRARPTLLVLDNFEQIVDGAPAVGELLEHAHGTRALVTSQLPLRIAREHLLRLAPLSADSAVMLFDERARAAAADFDLSEHREAVEAICARVDGMPLAIELAAARVSMIAPGELLARLDRSLGVLVRGPRDLAERHRSLRAALEWTHALLERDEQTLLARLAAFAGPAPLDAVEAVAHVTGERGPADALDGLSGLIDASLVRRTDSREHGVRYTVPQAVRDFAAEQLTASGEEHVVRSAHAAHIASVGETFRGLGTPDAIRAQVFALEAEQRVALDWTRAHAPDLHTRVATALGLVLFDTGRAREAYSELGFVIERSGITGAAGGWAALVRAYAAQSLGFAAEGGPLIEQGLVALRATGDEAMLQLGLRVACIFWRFEGESERSLEYAAEAVALARRRSHIGDLTIELLYQAETFVQLGRLDEAERLIDEAAPLIPQIGDSSFDVSGILADVAVERGDWALAGRLYAKTALLAGRNTGERIIQLRLTAIALAHLGHDEDALELEAAASSIGAAIGELVSDPMTAKHGWVLSEAREHVGPKRAAAAARRGHALPETESAARAAEMVQAACARASA